MLMLVTPAEAVGAESTMVSAAVPSTAVAAANRDPCRLRFMVLPDSDVKVLLEW